MVWELDGPMPILKMSKMLLLTWVTSSDEQPP
jgi:hypothetical protein